MNVIVEFARPHDKAGGAVAHVDLLAQVVDNARFLKQHQTVAVKLGLNSQVFAARIADRSHHRIRDFADAHLECDAVANEMLGDQLSDSFFGCRQVVEVRRRECVHRLHPLLDQVIDGPAADRTLPLGKGHARIQFGDDHLGVVDGCVKRLDRQPQTVLLRVGIAGHLQYRDVGLVTAALADQGVQVGQACRAGNRPAPGWRLRAPRRRKRWNRSSPGPEARLRYKAPGPGEAGGPFSKTAVSAPAGGSPRSGPRPKRWGLRRWTRDSR